MNPPRQAVRRKLFELAFADITQNYREPRTRRRKMARVIMKRAWRAHRNVQQQENPAA